MPSGCAQLGNSGPMLSSDTSGSRSSDEDTISRKRSELDGLRSRELLKALVELAPVGIAMFDRNLRYIHNNRRWQTVMAITNTDLSGRYHCDDLRPMPAKWIEAHR